MDHSSPNGSGASPNLVVDIIETLEACGLDRHEYQLNDSVDVEALEQVLHSSSGDAKVQFTVKGIRLAVTPESIDVLIDEERCSANQ